VFKPIVPLIAAAAFMAGLAPAAPARACPRLPASFKLCGPP